jgi:hypothetical protein
MKCEGRSTKEKREKHCFLSFEKEPLRTKEPHTQEYRIALAESLSHAYPTKAVFFCARQEADCAMESTSLTVQGPRR